MTARIAFALVLLGFAAAARAEEGPADLPAFRLDPGDVVVATSHADGSDPAAKGVLHVVLTAPKRQEFAAFTEGHVGQQVQVVICGRLVSTPVVKKKVGQRTLDILYPTPADAADAAKGLAAKPGAAVASPLPASPT